MNTPLGFAARVLVGMYMMMLVPAWSQTSPKPVSCSDDPAYHKLDFWLGNWNVFNMQDGSKDGTNRIEKILNGCALVENWHDVTGGEGKSLFYYQRATKQWKQVWVT